jgi:hypothetical protein
VTRGIIAGIAAAFVAIAHAASAGESPKFAAPRLVAGLETSAFLQEVGAADVTGDGNAEVVVTRIDSSGQLEPVTILVGDGKGHFADRTATLFDGAVPRTLWARRTVFADFNGDGRQDVFIADTGRDQMPFAGYPNTLLLSSAGGKLVDASASLPRQPDFTHSAAVGDVDGNGTLDIYAGNLYEGCAGCTEVPPEVLLNDGTGHFAVEAGALPDDVAGPFAPHYDGSALADVTGDGRPDLVLAGSPGTNSRVLVNDGTGHFAALANSIPPKPWGLSAEGLAVTAVELNGDGHLDLLIGYTKNDPFYVGRWIQVLINNGDGTFRDETSTRLPQSDNSGVWPYSIQVADVNHDGKPDIGVSLFPSPSQAPPFYLNRGDGTFAPISRNAFLSPPPQMFTLLDANRDGHLDVFGSTPAASGGPEEHYLVEQLARPGRVRAAKASRGTFRDRVRISWRAVPQSARYEVWRSLRSKRTRIGTTSSTRFEDRRARKGTRYRYFVRATNRVGVGAFSAGAVGYRR